MAPYSPSEREHAVLDLPWAGNQGPDEEPWARFVVNLEQEHGVTFAGMRWRLDSEHRKAAFEALVNSAIRWTNSMAREGRDAVALLHCDYRADWEDVGAVIRTLPEKTRVSWIVHLAVAATAPDAWQAARIEMRSVGDPFTPDTQLPVAIGVVRASGASGPSLRIRIGDRALTFAAGDPYASGAANELANTNWHAVLATLKAARADGDRSASLIVDDGVPWAYVAMTLGMLLEAEIADVIVDHQPFHLSTPPRTTVSWSPDDRDPRDWHPAFALGVGASIALAVFALGALAARRRRRPSDQRVAKAP